jgi:NAD-dependent deacetylase
VTEFAYNIERLAETWSRASSVVVLTGAGLSTASGIPDFRSPGGRWESYQPVIFQDFMASETSREEYWRYKGETWQVIASALPNAAHRALVAIAERDMLDLLVTQNVDGLHERSGFPVARLVDIHGTDARITCFQCGAHAERMVGQRQWESGVRVPRCDCGGAWKPSTISFGQSLVAEDLERSMRAAAECEMFVAAGTSLVVAPINQMFDIARAAGASTAILAASETPYDDQCTVKISDPVEEVLPALQRALNG